MFKLSDEQILELAMAIRLDIAPYIAAHRDEYEAYLREIEEDAYAADGAHPVSAQDGGM